MWGVDRDPDARAGPQWISAYWDSLEHPSQGGHEGVVWSNRVQDAPGHRGAADQDRADPFGGHTDTNAGSAWECGVCPRAAWVMEIHRCAHHSTHRMTAARFPA